MRRSTALPCFVVAVLSLPAPRAHAQPPVSAADREAARDLYKEGFDLQRNGRYAEALERFRRSQQVYPAPTALLHIAECEAQIGQLVEAAETYRTLARAPLAPDAPPAFVQAQTQGAAELQQIEPRIPHVRVDVTPPIPQNLVVLVDGQAMNTALLNVARPVDPGQHRIVGMAPGFENNEVVVNVAEKDPAKTITLTLKPGAGGLAVAPMPYPPQGLPPQPMPQPPPGQIIYYTQAPPPPPPPLAAPPSYYTVPARPLPPPGARTGLFVGPRVGVALPEGSNDLTNTAGPGVSLGAEVDLRFARRLFFGAVVDHAFLGTPSSAPSGLSSSMTNFDVTFGVITSPDHFAALFDIGIGYRILDQSFALISGTIHSPELILGTGLWIPTGHLFRIVPRLDAAFGSFTGSDASGNSTPGVGYAVLTLGVGGYFNIDFH